MRHGNLLKRLAIPRLPLWHGDIMMKTKKLTLVTLLAALPLCPGLVVAQSAPSLFQGEVGAVDYRLNEKIATFVVDVERDVIPADGQTPTRVSVRVLDKNAQPVQGVVFITVEVSAGRIQLPGARTDELGPGRLDADKVTRGTQIRVENGVTEFLLLAPFEPQEVKLRITAGNQEAFGTVSYVPEMRDMIAAGLLEGVIHFRHKSVLETQRPNDGFEREIRMWQRQFNDGKASASARVAFFLKGVIKGEYLLTAAYDSDADTQSRLLRDVRPDEFYPVYGDASIRGFDARTNGRLYVRVDKNKNYLMYGDFQTGDSFSQNPPGLAPTGGAVASQQLRALGNYSRTANGVRGHWEEGKLMGNVFVTRDSLRQVIQEFPSQGSGPYAVRGGDAVEGSEKVEILTRDRNNPSLILQTQALTRLVDYSFEPFSGRIILNQPLPAFDANLNPVSLRITYEVDQGGPKFWVYGLDGQFRLTDNIQIGGSYVTDQNPNAGYELSSVNLGIQLSERTLLVAEIARTQTDTGLSPTSPFGSPALQNKLGEASGSAWRLALSHDDGQWKARAVVARSDPEFFNPAAPFNAGKGEVSVGASYQVKDTVKLYGEVIKSEDRNTDAGVPISDQSGGQVGVAVNVSERLTLDVGVRHLRESEGKRVIATTPFTNNAGQTGSIASGSGGGFLGFGNNTQNTITGLGAGSSLTTEALGASSSTTVRLGVGFKATEKWGLGGEIETDIAGDERKRLALGTDYQVGERTKLYGRFERQTGLGSLYGQSNEASQGGNVFAAGVSSTIMKETQLFSEYRLRDAVNGRDIQQASGVRNAWDVAEGVRLGGSLESVRSLTSRAPSAWAVSGTMDYFHNPLWRSANKVEFRHSGDYLANTTQDVDESFNTWLWQFMLARKLDRDWTGLMRNYLLRTDYRSRGDILQNRAQLGLAYRDTDTNRVNALFKYEFKYEDDQSGLGVASGATAPTGGFRERAHIVSVHADYHPTRPWWTTGRVASKWSRGIFENGVDSRFRGTLLSGRTVYDLTENWDIGLIGSMLNDNAGGTQYGAGVEAGYLVRQNLWLSAGFNFTGFDADNDLAAGEYTNRGVYFRLRFKFDEDLFARDKTILQRSTDR